MIQNRYHPSRRIERISPCHLQCDFFTSAAAPEGGAAGLKVPMATGSEVSRGNFQRESVRKQRLDGRVPVAARAKEAHGGDGELDDVVVVVARRLELVKFAQVDAARDFVPWVQKSVVRLAGPPALDLRTHVAGRAAAGRRDVEKRQVHGERRVLASAIAGYDPIEDPDRRIVILVLQDEIDQDRFVRGKFFLGARYRRAKEFDIALAPFP